jgi:hypothetical protein
MIRIASFDIGKKNFAFCIEEYDKKALFSLKNISQNKYNSDGSPTPEMESLLKSIFNQGKIILHKNIDLTYNCDPKQKLDTTTFYNMNEQLDKYAEYWSTCEAIIIEEQMSFGGKTNTMAVKLGQHCFSYFTLRYDRSLSVMEFPAYYKTQILGAPKIAGKAYKNGNVRFKAMEKPQRKKWAVAKTVEILTDRNELETIQGMKKKDDLADTFLMIQAFKYLVYVEKKFKI